MSAIPLGPVRIRGMALPRPAASSLLTCGIFLATLALRSPALLLRPRLWAEEGGLYWERLRHLPIRTGLGLVVNGNYQLLTNAFVAAAKLVPARDIAWVTTYAALIVSLLCCWMLDGWVRAHGLPRWVGAVAAVMLALLPAGYEVYLSATNVQWTCSLLALLICLGEDLPAVSVGAALRYALLAICGLTGLPSCILGPVFLVEAWRRRTAYGWAMLTVITAASAVQIGVILAHRGEISAVRPFNVSLLVLVPMAMHDGLALFLPMNFINVGAPGLASTASRLQLAIAGLGLLALIATLARDRLGRYPALVLAGAAVLASVMNEVGALSPVEALVSGMAGGRYFFLGQCCIVLLLTAGLAAPGKLTRIVTGVMVMVLLLHGGAEVLTGEWSGQSTTGPSFAEQVDACPDEGPCKVRAWPMWTEIWVTIRDDNGSP